MLLFMSPIPQVLGMSLEFAGAPLRLEKKVAFLEKRKEERKGKGAKKVRWGSQ